MKTLGLMLLSIAGFVFRAYTIVVLWTWFMVPTFRLPHLSIPAGIGLSMVISLLTYQQVNCSKKDAKENDIAVLVFSHIVYTLFALIFGWIAKQLM